jgi:hypothetical protein
MVLRFVYLAYHLVVLLSLALAITEAFILPKFAYVFLLFTAIVLFGMDILKHLSGSTGILRYMYFVYNFIVAIFAISNIIDLEAAFKILFGGVLLFGLYQAFMNITAIMGGDIGGF